jgi:hypothetical protein
MQDFPDRKSTKRMVGGSTERVGNISVLQACNCCSKRSPNFQPWRYCAPDVAGGAMIDAGAAIVPTELAPADPVSVPPKPDPAGGPPKPDDPVTPAERVPADPAGVPTADVIAVPCASTLIADDAMIDAGAAIVPTEAAPADPAGAGQPI